MKDTAKCCKVNFFPKRAEDAFKNYTLTGGAVNDGIPKWLMYA